MAIQDVYDAVLHFDKANIANYVQKEIDAGTGITDILEKGLIGALDEVGRRFSDGTFFVPEMLNAATIMKVGLELLRPLLQKANVKTKGTIVIGTVKGDLHDIGKNIVAMMLEGSGFEVHDLGVDVNAEKFITSLNEKNADIIAMSALLTTTMPAMEESVAAIKQAALDTRIIVGGAPVTEQFAAKIGADGYAPDAPSAVELGKRLLNF